MTIAGYLFLLFFACCLLTFVFIIFACGVISSTRNSDAVLLLAKWTAFIGCLLFIAAFVSQIIIENS